MWFYCNWAWADFLQMSTSWKDRRWGRRVSRLRRARRRRSGTTTSLGLSTRWRMSWRLSEFKAWAWVIYLSSRCTHMCTHARTGWIMSGLALRGFFSSNFVYTHIYTYVYVCIYVYKFVYVCIYVYTCIHICIYVSSQNDFFEILHHQNRAALISCCRGTATKRTGRNESTFKFLSVDGDGEDETAIFGSMCPLRKGI